MERVKGHKSTANWNLTRIVVFQGIDIYFLKFKSMSQYSFVTQWSFQAPLEKVWNEISDMDRWPEWWKMLNVWNWSKMERLMI